MTFQTFCVYYVGILHMYNLGLQQLYYMSANKVEGKRVGSSRRGFTYLTTIWMVILNSRLAVKLYQNNKTFELFHIIHVLPLFRKICKEGGISCPFLLYFLTFFKDICRDIINRGKKLYHFLTPLPFFYKIHLLYILPMILTPKISFILSPY